MIDKYDMSKRENVMQDNGMAYTTEAEGQFTTVIDNLTQELKSRGYGVLAAIDVKKIMKEKLGEDMSDYTILEVCNPKHAKKALDAHKEAGLILPCKITVYENGGKSKISLYKPTRAIKQLGVADLDSLATQVEEELSSALDAISV